ncbi:MAG: tetratricopeptide repeat protein [Pseudomonadota bacterium]
MAGTGKPRAGLWALTGFVCLTACAAQTGKTTGNVPENPLAPGVATRGETVDQMLVAHRLMAAGEFEMALSAFHRATLDQGMNAEILAGLGSAHLGLGHLETAEPLLRRSLEEKADAPEVWNNLGVLLLEKNEVSEAEHVFRRAFALDDGQSDEIRDNLRLALAKSEEYQYTRETKQEYKLVRRGSSNYLIRPTPE